jgi:hypothetical protein
MKVTASNLIRWSGLAAMGTGILFIVIQAVHPLDLLENVGSGTWAIAHYMGVAMGILGIFGMTGLYARQLEKAGWLGLIGYLLLTIFYALITAFQFIEAYITPVLTTAAPQFVEAFLAVAAGKATEFDLGALPTVYMMLGLVGYTLGGLLFGIATFRAGVLPRWAGALLAIAVLLPIVATGLFPHPLDRIFAVPVGLALAWMGYALWTGRGEQPSQSFSGTTAQLRQTGA